MTRCRWADPNSELYVAYHDHEWGRPEHDDQKLFEMLILESFQAGCLFAQTEGIIPAPESCHAIAATIREANKCKESGEEKVILFNLSGHGLIDMASYDKFLAGDLVNYSLSDEEINQNIKELDDMFK